jgi:hypothetical protein
VKPNEPKRDVVSHNILEYIRRAEVAVAVTVDAEGLNQEPSRVVDHPRLHVQIIFVTDVGYDCLQCDNV